ncbi:MAG: hypothetical protein QOH16_1651 [Gaiellaceae bacterium]|nr:hypothetical protein [Gaiellaceae bacterium]
MNSLLRRRSVTLFTAIALACAGVAGATISSAAADGGAATTATTSTDQTPTVATTTGTTTTDPTTTTATTPTTTTNPTTTTTPPTTTTTPTTTGTTTTDPTTTGTTTTVPTTTTTPIIPAVVPPVLPGGFAQAVTTVTTVVVGAPITVAGTIATSSVTNTAVTNTTVINTTTINNLPPVVLGAAAGAAGAAPVAADICVNLPGSQPSVPAGKVLTLAKNGALVCVSPTIARVLHPAAVAYTVPAGSRIIFPKKGGGLCIGKATGKRVKVSAKTSAKKVIALANSGKLVCLGP